MVCENLGFSLDTSSDTISAIISRSSFLIYPAQPVSNQRHATDNGSPDEAPPLPVRQSDDIVHMAEYTGHDLEELNTLICVQVEWKACQEDESMAQSNPIYPLVGQYHINL